MGELIANAMEIVGKDGVITVEEGKSMTTELTTVEGMQFDRGYASAYMVTNTEKMEAVLDNPYILITDKKISSLQEILPIIEPIAQQGARLLIIAEDVEGDALAALIVNKLKGVLNCVAVKAPGFGDRRKAMLEDIAILTGGTVVSSDLGYEFKNVTMDMLGRAAQVKVDKDNTTIINGAGGKRRNKGARGLHQGSDSRNHLRLRQREAAGTPCKTCRRRGSHKRRRGDRSRDEGKEAAHRGRALRYPRGSRRGHRSGGGTTLLACIPEIKKLADKLEGDEKTGAQIVLRAIEEPVRQIAKNAGLDGSVIVNNILTSKKANYGFDALKNEYTDMVASGIIDPTKVTRSALQNAATRYLRVCSRRKASSPTFPLPPHLRPQPRHGRNVLIEKKLKLKLRASARSFF